MSRVVSFVPVVALVVIASGCEKTEKGTSTTTAAVQPGSTSLAVPTEQTPTQASPAAPEAPKTEPTAAAAHTPVMTYKNVGLSKPESVLYDSVADVYLVSNVEGKPLEADGKGFISRLTPDGKVETLKWIESGKNKATLNAPKGMAVMGDTLYVADIDTVRMFDRKTGAPTGEVKVPGATFLNDITVAPDGRVLVSDMGMKSSAKGTEASGADAVYAIDKAKKLTTVAKGKELGNPNGLLSMGDKTWVVTFGTGEMYSLDAKGKKGDAKKLPKGSLDGVVALPGGEILVSSWDASAVYRGKPGGEFVEVVRDLKSPADIGYDTKRNRLLVPLFDENEIRAYEMK